MDKYEKMVRANKVLAGSGCSIAIVAFGRECAAQAFEEAMVEAGGCGHATLARWLQHRAAALRVKEAP